MPALSSLFASRIIILPALDATVARGESATRCDNCGALSRLAVH
jgi:DTW domain-containing protein YfiP